VTIKKLFKRIGDLKNG